MRPSNALGASKKNLCRDWQAIADPMNSKITKELQQLHQKSTKQATKFQNTRQEAEIYFQNVFLELEAAKQKFMGDLQEFQEQYQYKLSKRIAILESSLDNIEAQTRTYKTWCASLSEENSEQWLITESRVRKDFDNWQWTEKPPPKCKLQSQLPDLSGSINQIGIHVPIATEVIPVTLETLNNLTLEAQNQILGGELYMLIAKTQPQFAGKITGMILESCDKDEMLLLIQNQNDLNEKVCDALNILSEFIKEQT